MKLFYVGKDGGCDSNVTGFWLIEWKRFFSIALLRFDHGSREAYHSHAFNSMSWVLWGELLERQLIGFDLSPVGVALDIPHKPSFRPVFTPRECLHKVFGIAPRTWVLTFRGPWADKWKEQFNDGREVTLTHGRKQVEK